MLVKENIVSVAKKVNEFIFKIFLNYSNMVLKSSLRHICLKLYIVPVFRSYIPCLYFLQGIIFSNYV